MKTKLFSKKFISAISCVVALALLFSVIQIGFALNDDETAAENSKFSVSLNNGDFSAGLANWEGTAGHLAADYGNVTQDGYFALTTKEAWVGITQTFKVTGLQNDQKILCAYDYQKKSPSDAFRVDIEYKTETGSATGESTGNILVDDKYGLKEGWSAATTPSVKIEGINGEYGEADVTVSVRSQGQANADDVYFDNIRFYLYDEAANCYYDANNVKTNVLTLMPYYGTEEDGIYLGRPGFNNANLSVLSSEEIQNLDFSQGLKYWGPIDMNHSEGSKPAFASDYASVSDGAVTVSTGANGAGFGIGTVFMGLGADYKGNLIEGNIALLYKFKSNGGARIDVYSDNGDLVKDMRGNIYATDEWQYGKSEPVNFVKGCKLRLLLSSQQDATLSFDVSNITFAYANEDGTFTDVYTGTVYNSDGTPTGGQPDPGPGGEGGDNPNPDDDKPKVNSKLLNADFSNGLNSWEAVSGSMAENAVAKSDSANGKYISLISKTAWTGIKQAFKVSGLKNGQKVAVAFDYKKNDSNDALRVDLNLVTGSDSAVISEGNGNITFPNKVGLHKGWTASISDAAKLNNINENGDTTFEITVRAAADNSGKGILIDNIQVLIYDDSLSVAKVNYPCYYTLGGTKLNVNTLAEYDGTSKDGIYIPQTDNNGFNYFSLYHSKLENLDFSQGLKYWAYVTDNPTKSVTSGYASKVAKVNSDKSVTVKSNNTGDGIGSMWMNAGKDSKGNPVNGSIAIAYQYTSTGNGNVEVHCDGFKGVSRVIGSVEKNSSWQTQISPAAALEADNTNMFHVRISAADGGVTIKVRNIAIVYVNADGSYTNVYTGKKYSTDTSSSSGGTGGSGNSGSSGGSGDGGSGETASHIGTKKDGIFNEQAESLGNKFPIRTGFMNGDFSKGLMYWLGNRTGYTSLVAHLKSEKGNNYVSMSADDSGPAMITQTNFILPDVAPGTELYALMNYRGDNNIEFGGYTCNAKDGTYPLTRITGVQIVYEPAETDEWGIAMSATPITVPENSQIDPSCDEQWGTDFGGKIAYRLCITINGKNDLDNIRFVKKLSDGTLVELNGKKVDIPDSSSGGGTVAVPEDFDWSQTWGSSSDDNSSVGAGVGAGAEEDTNTVTESSKGVNPVIIIIAAAALAVLIGAGALVYFLVIKKKLHKRK